MNFPYSFSLLDVLVPLGEYQALSGSIGDQDQVNSDLKLSTHQYISGDTVLQTHSCFKLTYRTESEELFKFHYHVNMVYESQEKLSPSLEISKVAIAKEAWHHFRDFVEHSKVNMGVTLGPLPRSLPMHDNLGSSQVKHQKIPVDSEQ